MEKLLDYLNSLSKPERSTFAGACNTTEGYLRKAISIKQRLSAELCMAIDCHSGAKVCCEDLRPDLNWAYLRSIPADRQS
jgi:DNA-binding transcriptional regulator YdaS (Cro superfamily)